MRRWNRGRPATLIDWLCTWAIFAVFCLLLWQGLWRSWYGGNTPEPVRRYYQWSAKHFPWWFPL